ncbi:hypothetical protein MLD38_011916 [Melastoma candidum]|uniref:Uncharacterized protein n=1 Tax=Melastoma candidum TaxID=119954 RepID=A0ACB9R4Q7_9MYRT|nr:hypothetical protein MLD38_011916 [Melastoma candidum]
MKFSGSSSGGAGTSNAIPRLPGLALDSSSVRGLSRRSSRITGDYQLPRNSIGQDVEELPPKCHKNELLRAIEPRLEIIFPPQMTHKSSNVKIAKQHLKMILFSDRCAVSDEAKQKKS